MTNTRKRSRHSSTKPSRLRSAFPGARKRRSAGWPQITAEALQLIREDLCLAIDFGRRVAPQQLERRLRKAMLGPVDEQWQPPHWLELHQRDAARRVRATLATFRGALLADAVGLGKTFVALGVGTAYPSVVVMVPAVLRPQWQEVAARLQVKTHIMTHEGLSRGLRPPEADLFIIDEAHRFRNPGTRRYDQLARSIRRARVLLVTATPVVNRAADMVHLLRLFSPDHAFVMTGMSSLELSFRRCDQVKLTFAIAPAIIARSTRTVENLLSVPPHVHDSKVVRASTVSTRTLRTVLKEIDALSFPTLGQSRERELLRLHLLYRLASSASACRESVKRHLAYLYRAREAATRGERLSRAQARRIFTSEDELQLNVVAWNKTDCDKVPPSVDAITSEQARLHNVLRALSVPNDTHPKVDELARMLNTRRGQKTIVFTAAVTTAIDIARWIGWREVAVVGAGRARIASGIIGVPEALSLFAPHGTGARRPPRVKHISTLIATDLVSEGLNLQDADAVVHYDLPWTPLRLQQRVGRIARLRSTHSRVLVYWFGSHPDLEARLGLEERVTCKAARQLDLGVIATSRVGRARLINRAFEQRELLARCPSTTGFSPPGYAVVRGPMAAAVTVAWRRDSWVIPELVVLAGSPLLQQQDFGEMQETLRTLLMAPVAEGSPPPQNLVNALTKLIQQRMGRSNCGPINANSNRLARLITRHGYVAGKARHLTLLRTLDAALDRVQVGLPVGAERELADLLNGDVSISLLSAWLQNQPPVSHSFPSFHIDAALFGDGSILL